MNNVNNTLYIPLYGKALVSRRGILLHDPKAEEIWAAEGFALKGKSRSKWLAYYMAMRAAVHDRWLKEKMEEDPGAVVLHLGCGMDSRNLRVGTRGHQWFDVDFPEVIGQRRRYFRENEEYRMLRGDLRRSEWIAGLPGTSAIVVMEGVSMYLTPGELKALLRGLQARFGTLHILMDCYTTFAARASRVKNPINDVGVTEVHGLDDPKLLEGEGLRFLGEREITPPDLVAELQGLERTVFQKLYAGALSKKLYRLYEFEATGRNE